MKTVTDRSIEAARLGDYEYRTGLVTAKGSRFTGCMILGIQIEDSGDNDVALLITYHPVADPSMTKRVRIIHHGMYTLESKVSGA